MNAFRHAVYGCFKQAGDALFNTVDALSSETAAHSFPELSLWPVFQRRWPKHLFGDAAPQHPTQHRVRTVSPVLALPMGVVVLLVVIAPPGLVGLLDLWPGARVGERMVG